MKCLAFKQIKHQHILERPRHLDSFDLAYWNFGDILQGLTEDNKPCFYAYLLMLHV